MKYCDYEPVLCDYRVSSGDVSALAGDVSSPGSGQSESTCSSPNTATHDSGTKFSSLYRVIKT